MCVAVCWQKSCCGECFDRLTNEKKTIHVKTHAEREEEKKYNKTTTHLNGTYPHFTWGNTQHEPSYKHSISIDSLNQNVQYKCLNHLNWNNDANCFEWATFTIAQLLTEFYFLLFFSVILSKLKNKKKDIFFSTYTISSIYSFW